MHLALREHMLLPGQESIAVGLPMDAVAHEGRERKKLGRGLILDQVKGFGKSTVSQGMAVLTHSTSQLGLSSQLKDSEKQKKRQSAILQVPTDADDREKSSARESEKGTVGGLEPSQSSEKERDENESEEEKRKRRERRRERKEKREKRKSCEITGTSSETAEEAERKRERREKKKREKKERIETSEETSQAEEYSNSGAEVERRKSSEPLVNAGENSEIAKSETEYESEEFGLRISFDDSERSEQGISLAEYQREQERARERESEEERKRVSGSPRGTEERERQTANSESACASGGEGLSECESERDSSRVDISINVEDVTELGEKQKRTRSLSGGDKRTGKFGSTLGRLRAGIDRKISTTGSRIAHRDRSPMVTGDKRSATSSAPDCATTAAAAMPKSPSSHSLSVASERAGGGEGNSGRKRHWLKSSMSSKFQFQASKHSEASAKAQSTAAVTSSSRHRHSRSLDNEELEIIRHAHSTSEVETLQRSPLEEGHSQSSTSTVGDGALVREGLRNISGGVAVMGRLGAKLKEDIEMKRKQASASAKSLEAKASRKNPLNKLPIRRTQKGQGGSHVGKSATAGLTHSMMDCRDEDEYFGALYTMQVSVVEGQELSTSGAVGVYCSVSITDAGTGEAFYLAKTSKAKELSWPDSVFETLVFFDRVLKVTVTVKAATTGPDLLLGSTYVLVDKPEAFASFDNWLPLLDPNTQTANKARGLVRLAISMVRAVPAEVQQEEFVEKKSIAATQTAEQRESHQKSLTRMWETTMNGGGSASHSLMDAPHPITRASTSLSVTTNSPTLSSSAVASGGGGSALPAGVLGGSPTPSSSGELSAKPRLIKALARPFAHKRGGSLAKRPLLEAATGDSGALAAYFYQSGDMKETYALPQGIVEAEISAGGVPVVIPFVRKFPPLALTKKLTLFPDDVAKKHSRQVEGSAVKQPEGLPQDCARYVLPLKCRKVLECIYVAPHPSPPLKWRVPLLKRSRADEDDSDEDDSDDEGVPLEDMDGEGKALSKLAGFEKLNEEVSASGPAADFLETRKERMARLQEERIVKKNTRREVHRTKKDMALAYSSLGLSHHNMNKMLLTFTSGASDWMAWRVRFNTAIGRGMEQLGISVGEVQALEYPVHETWVYCQRKFGDARDETVLEKFQKVTVSQKGSDEAESEETKALRRTTGDKNLLHLLPSTVELRKEAMEREEGQKESEKKNESVAAKKSVKQSEREGERKKENVASVATKVPAGRETDVAQKEGPKKKAIEGDHRKLLLRQTTSGTLITTRAGSHRTQHNTRDKATKKETPEAPVGSDVKARGRDGPPTTSWRAPNTERVMEKTASFSSTGGISRQRGNTNPSPHKEKMEVTEVDGVVLAEGHLVAQPVEEQVVQLPHLFVGGVLLVLLCLAYLFLL